MVLRNHPTDYNIFTQQPTLSWWISNLPWLLHPPGRKVPGFHLDESALPTYLEGRRRVSAAAEMAVREEEPQGSLSPVLSQCKFKSHPKKWWKYVGSWFIVDYWQFEYVKNHPKKRLNIEHQLSVENHTQHIVIYCNDHHPNMYQLSLNINKCCSTLFDHILRPRTSSWWNAEPA